MPGTRTRSFLRQNIVPLALASLLVICGTNTQAGSPVTEQTSLELILRQLDTIDRISRSSAALPIEDGARYTFDYSRFTAEIELIREGIKAQRSPTPATINLVQRPH
jgi:RAQPRD family integrative conjugative element protein